MARGTFTTTLSWEVDGEETEASVRVLYSFCLGYPATMEDPGSEGEMEIISLTCADPTIVIPARFETDEALLNECVSDYLDEQERVADWRAQNRRDDLLMERF